MCAQIRHPRGRPLAGLITLTLVSGSLASGLSIAQPQAESAAQSPSAEPQEIIVTATLLPRLREDIAGTVSVITAADMERQMANDIGDLIRYQPGISMDTAARGGNQGFVIRGIGGNRVLTVIDGVRSADIYAAGPASYGKDAFEMDDLKAVEIIRGPASVLYGADAMGGAVILRTRDASDYLVNGESHYLSVRGGAASADDQLKGGLTYATRLGDVDTVIQLTHREYGEREVKGPGRLNPQDGTTQSGLIKLGWQPAPAHQLSLAADFRKDDADTRLDNELSASVLESLAFDSSHRQRISLRHDWQMDALLADSITTQVHYQETLGKQRTTQILTSYAFVNPMNPPSFAGTQAFRESDFRFNQDTRSASVWLFKNIAGGNVNQHLVYGATYELTQTERPRHRCDTEISSGAISCAIPSYPMGAPEVFPNKTFPDTRTARSGLFIQNEVSLFDNRLSIIPGLRLDRYRMTPRPDALFFGHADVEELSGHQIASVDETETSFNLGVIYRLTDQWSLGAQYAEGFRPANFDEANQAFINAGHGYAIVPNPELGAETSKGYEASLRFSSDALYMTWAVYLNEYDNFIESRMLGTIDGLSLFQNENIGEARIHGTELSAEWFFAPQWSWHNALAWSRGEDRRSGMPLDSVDPLTAVSSLRFQPLDGLQLRAAVSAARAQNRVSAPDRVTGEAWQTVDLLAHIDLNDQSSLQLGIFNLFDEQYARWSSIQGLAATDTANIANAQAPGIHARAAFRYQF